MLNIFVNIFKWLFKEYPKLEYTFSGEKWAMIFDMIGGYSIALSFLTMGMVFIWKAVEGKPDKTLAAYKERRILSQVLGLSLFFCGTARVLTELSIYHSYLHIHIIIKIISGFFGLVALGYTPLILRRMRQAKTMEEVTKTMEQTKEKLETIKQLNEKLNEDGHVT